MCVIERGLVGACCICMRMCVYYVCAREMWRSQVASEEKKEERTRRTEERTCVRRQGTHMALALYSMDEPHKQHSI